MIKLINKILAFFVREKEPIPDEHATIHEPIKPPKNLTKNFTLSEFLRSSTAAARGISNKPTNEHLANLLILAQALEEVRKLCANQPIYISSGYRNPEVNKLVGGVPNSAHAKGYAADFTVKGIPTKEVCKIIANSGLVFDQLIYEQGNTKWVHLSVDPQARRQVLSWRSGRGYVNGLVDL